jgi:hypothetical protein
MMDKVYPLRTLKTKFRPSRHIYLHVEAHLQQYALVAMWRRAWLMDYSRNGASASIIGQWDTSAGLDALLDAQLIHRGPMTIWMRRGWDDLVLTGLADIIDRGRISYKYMNMHGHRLILRGTYGGRALAVTSFGNWTGGPLVGWDRGAWASTTSRMHQSVTTALRSSAVPGSESELDSLACWCAIAGTCDALGAATVEPTAAVAGQGMWRRWLGPRLEAEEKASGRGKNRGKPATTIAVAPWPYRSASARQSERHACYGLIQRQYRVGAVTGPIHVVDLRASYWQALAEMAFPLRCRKKLHRPSPIELGKHLLSGPGLALVYIETSEIPYPARRRQRVAPALGRYWTWLAGAELVMALVSGAVLTVESAFVWTGASVSASGRECMTSVMRTLSAPGASTSRSAWRAMYSALVGSWAGRRRQWRDVPPRAGCDRWGQYWRANSRTGKIAACRAIAGRHQELVEVDDATSSVAMAYGCVTAWVRCAMASLRDLVGAPNCVALVADSLWVTEDGLAALRAAATPGQWPHDCWAVKATYDIVWMDGGSRAVLERGGMRILRSPGFPDGWLVSGEDRAEHLASPRWGESVDLDPSHPRKRKRQRYNISKFVDEFGAPAVVQPLGEPLDDPLLSEELLLPLTYHREMIDDQE